MNILITSVGRRVSLVEIFKTELSKIFPEGKVFTVDSQIQLSAACKVADGAFNVPKVNDNDYLQTLIDICTVNEISLIVPTIDTELKILAQNKEVFLEHNVNVVISSLGFIEKCRNKYKIHDFFAANNIEVAKEYDKNDYNLPLFIKPYDGSRSVDTYVIQKQEDLTEYHFKNEKLMFLEYLSPSEFQEYTCDLYFDKNHDLKCAVPRKRLEVRDGEVSKGKTEENSIIPYIKKRLHHIEGARGCLTVQFFKHKTDDRIVGIEVNPRFGGGFPLTYHAGANYVKWLIEEYLLDKKIDEQFNSWEPNLLMLRYDKEILVHEHKD
ncbi:ATP-grasp domain-containing protein [Flagellimonas sp. HMM57]|uniref:ATP-grasp domain-containing protein n=1 Tax=unclassified Flagellimonas TaxID=2644544 RepID=UPI0013D11C0C|nr:MULTISPECIES: ATP-grasp domain-containing protein [unclassified Flagellimonas]UII76142.1 ATP-grasp domain-containing protein [Flagellimonas sp. HMM57]